jgi:hypothetical protein
MVWCKLFRVRKHKFQDAIIRKIASKSILFHYVDQPLFDELFHYVDQPLFAKLFHYVDQPLFAKLFHYVDQPLFDELFHYVDQPLKIKYPLPCSY